MQISNGDPFIIIIPDAAVTAGDASSTGGIISIDLGYFASAGVPPVLASGFTVTGGTAAFGVGASVTFANGFDVTAGTPDFQDGVLVSVGDLTMTLGDVILDAGDVTITAGDLTIAGLGAVVNIGPNALSDSAGTLVTASPFTCATPLTIGAVTITDTAGVAVFNGAVTCSSPLTVGTVTLTDTAGTAAVGGPLTATRVEETQATESNPADSDYLIVASTRTVQLATTGGAHAVNTDDTGVIGQEVFLFLNTVSGGGTYTCALEYGKTATFSAAGDSLFIKQVQLGSWVPFGGTAVIS